MKKVLSLLAFLVCCQAVSSVFAQTPRRFSYQGILLDAATKKPVNGLHTITVRLYDSPSGGNILHTESFTTYLENGVFTTMIGAQTEIPSSVQFDKQYWLGVTVDATPEMPRTALESSPYAFHAGSASALAKGATGAVTSMNGISGDVTFKGGKGTEITQDGNNIIISANSTNISGGNPTTQAIASITGTANQVLANGTSGIAQINAVTLTTPQDIGPASSVVFANEAITGLNTAGVVHNSALGALSTSLITNADVAPGASIGYGKLFLSNSILNSDINAGAGIVYSKLSLGNSIVNSDINAAAGISYSKLNLSNSIVDADINASAGIVDTKLATISTAGKVANSATTGTSSNTGNALVLRDGSGNFSAGQITATQIGSPNNTELDFVTNGAVRARFKESTGDTVTAGAFEPGMGDTYSLGTADRPWQNLFISPGTITFTASTGAHSAGSHGAKIQQVINTGTLSFDNVNNVFTLDHPLVNNYAEITAANNVNIPATSTVTVLVDPVGGISPYSYTISNGVNGQLIFIINRASHTAQNSIANISSNKGISLMWVGGATGKWIQITNGN